MDSDDNFGRMASSQEALVEIAQGGSGALAKAATEQLLLMHEPLMKREIRAAYTPYTLPPELYSDALQAAREGALEALGRFDLSRGFAFATFARKHIRGRVLRAIYGKARRRKSDQSAATSPDSVRVVSLEERLENDPGSEQDLLGRSEEGFEWAEKSDMLEKVGRFVDGLPARQAYIVCRVFRESRSQAEVARELGVSEAAVSQTLGRVYAKGKVSLAEFEGVLAA